MRGRTLMILGIASLGLAGCATEQDSVYRAAQLKPYYDPAPAAALVFDPPMTRYAPLPAFARDGRSPSAFYGYEQPSVDTYYLYQRDQQRGFDLPDRYDRTTYSGRSTTTYR
jgi:hypothetical protein